MKTEYILIGSVVAIAAYTITRYFLKKYQMKDIHIHVHNQSEKDISKIFETVSIINSKIDVIMANEQQFKAALAKIDAATTASGLAATAIQARIDALTAAIQNAGLPADVEAALLAQTEGLGSNAEALAAALAAMGATPENPVPVEPPPPVEPVEPPVG